MTFFEKVRRQKFLSITMMVFMLSIGILIGTVLQTVGVKAAKEGAVAPDAAPLSVSKAEPMHGEFAELAKQLGPSVVNISTEYIPKKETASKANPHRRQQQDDEEDGSSGNTPDGGLNDFFQRFFGGQGGGAMPFQQQEQPSAALGSGFVVDRNGYIITNNHVVEKATKIKVTFLNDKTEYPATVIGTDKDTDLAVIHVDRRNLTPVKIGNADALQVGDWVIAIGSPFGFQATVTAGIVSSLARDIPGDATSFQHFIQTDAAINPGNSGGPLANVRGEIVGINTMIASRSGGYQGIGFAMPINAAVKVYNQIIQSGHVTRGSVGIRFSEDKNISDLLKVYGADHGVFVQSVEPNGPADKAGMKAQDVITNIGDKKIEKGQDLIDTVADSPVGSSLKVGIVRDKKPMTLNVIVGDRTKIFAEQYGGKKEETPDSQGESAKLKFGISVQSLRQADRENLGFTGKNGVLVGSVETGSFADDIGLAKGDIIVELNRQTVNSPDDVRKIQNSLKVGDPVAFHVMRQVRNARGSGDWQSLFLAGSVPAASN